MDGLLEFLVLEEESMLNLVVDGLTLRALGTGIVPLLGEVEVGHLLGNGGLELLLNLGSTGDFLVHLAEVVREHIPELADLVDLAAQGGLEGIVLLLLHHTTPVGDVEGVLAELGGHAVSIGGVLNTLVSGLLPPEGEAGGAVVRHVGDAEGAISGNHFQTLVVQVQGSSLVVEVSSQGGLDGLQLLQAARNILNLGLQLGAGVLKEFSLALELLVRGIVNKLTAGASGTVTTPVDVLPEVRVHLHLLLLQVLLDGRHLADFDTGLRKRLLEHTLQLGGLGNLALQRLVDPVIVVHGNLDSQVHGVVAQRALIIGCTHMRVGA
mmetsp:Transcript_4061/g.4637  ORF Transcript_4061/g.4637 Transcript_4061/m.4637 type:complete len:323 (+) Transcript_4061:775-1743(+)